MSKLVDWNDRSACVLFWRRCGCGGAVAGRGLALLDATRREEKQSVMEQLKTKPPQEKEKSKKAPSIGAEMER
jgi:hypothetical protein